MSDDAVLRKMDACADRTHREIEATQIKHVADEYTDERIATLMAKVEAARRYWDWNDYKVNL